jgi:hypothetical protein
MPTKNELLAEAEALGLVVPKSANKALVETLLNDFKESKAWEEADAAEEVRRRDAERSRRAEETLSRDNERNRRVSVDEPTEGCSICESPAVWASDGRVASQVFYCQNHYNKYGEG